MVDSEERTDEEEIAVTQQVDPDFDPDEVRIELMAAGLNPSPQWAEALEKTLWRWQRKPPRRISSPTKTMKEASPRRGTT